MKLLADMHISPRTVAELRAQGYDAIRVSDVLPGDASDLSILDWAEQDDRTVVTQPLDFSQLAAIGRRSGP